MVVQLAPERYRVQFRWEMLDAFNTPAFDNIGRRENVHLVQADIFKPPFREGAFDHAYSIGVLHHTPDTRRASRRPPPFPRPGSGR